MSDEKKKGGFFKKLVFAVVFLAVVPWAGYWAYAKTRLYCEIYEADEGT